MLILIAVLAVGLINPGAVLAQATDGNIVGTILDTTGAAVPNTQIEAENVGTGVKYNTKADSNGLYRLNNVPVGTYILTATAQGFGVSKLQNVQVQLNQTSTANFTLQVGQVSTTVEVIDAAAMIDTTTAQVQSTYTTKQAVDLPITALPLGPINLALLGAGVASSGGTGLGEGPSVGGQRPRNNSFQVEGVDNNRKDVTGSNVRIPNEATQEVTILQNQFTAEFGHSGGGQFNTTVRSGTNEVHGAAYWYLQNRNLNAMDQAQKRTGLTENQRYDENRIGGNVGLPIVKNRLFAFYNYEYNPVGAASTPGSASLAPTAAGLNMIASIPGISATNFNIFKQYVPVAPVATSTTTISGRDIPIGELPIAFPVWNNTHFHVASVNYHVGQSDELRFRYANNLSSGYDRGVVPNLPAFLQQRQNRSHLVTLSEYHTFSPTVTNELRLNYSRYSDNIPSGEYDYPGLDMFPGIYLSDDLNLEIGPYSESPQSGIINTYQLVENLNWNPGSHALKFGYDGRKYIAPTNFIQRMRGDYWYSTLDRYLLDLPPDYLAQRNLGGVPYSGNAMNHYLYANDNWRIRPNFSVTLGVRWEYKGIPAGDKLQALNAAASVPGFLEFREPKAEKNNFAPRIGIAYSPGQSGLTSIRAGFGMAYDNYFDNLGTLSKPVQLENTVDDPLDGDTPGYLAAGGIRPDRRPGELDAETARAFTSTYIPDQKLPYSMTWNVGVQRVFRQDYTAEVRYVGTRGVNLFVQDVINRRARVTPERNLPLFYSRPSQAELDRLTLTLNDLQAESTILPNWFAAGFQSPITVFNNRGNSIYHGLQSELTRRYSSNLLFKAAYTWSKAIDDSTADLFSTLLSPRRPQDFQNWRSERARSFLDRTHRFTFSWVYDARWFEGSNWFVRNIVGNWNIGGIYTYETPQYATVQSGGDANLNGDSAPDRVIINVNGQKNVGSGVTALRNSGNRVVGYLVNNPNAQYIAGAPGLLVNGGRQTLPIRPINNWDLNLTKAFSVGEGKRIQFRAFFFNAFNHAQYIAGSINTVQAVSSNSTRNNLIPGLDEFNDPSRVYSSNPRNIQLVARFEF